MKIAVSTHRLLDCINRKCKCIRKHASRIFWALASIVLKFDVIGSHVICSMPVHRETLNKLPIIDVILLLPETVKLTFISFDFNLADGFGNGIFATRSR